jgi:hypothetical protein
MRLLMSGSALFLLATVIGCGASSSSGSSQPQPETGVVEFEDRLIIEENDDRSPLRIPRAQLPQLGECRVWDPTRPVARQAPAGPCTQVEPAAQPESWVLYRPRQDPRLIHVRIIDPERAGVVTRIRVYDAERGTYLGTKQRK